MCFLFLYLLGAKFAVGHSHLFRRGGGGEKLPCFSVALLSLVQVIDFTVGYSSTNSTVQNILKGYALS